MMSESELVEKLAEKLLRHEWGDSWNLLSNREKNLAQKRAELAIEFLTEQLPPKPSTGAGNE